MTGNRIEDNYQNNCLKQKSEAARLCGNGLKIKIKKDVYSLKMEKDCQRNEEGDKRQAMSNEGQVKKVHRSLKRDKTGQMWHF